MQQACGASGSQQSCGNQAAQGIADQETGGEVAAGQLGLDGAAGTTIGEAARDCRDRPVGLVLGAEGPGLRERTRATCDRLVRIPAAGDFGSLNVSNAAAVALYALGQDAAGP